MKDKHGPIVADSVFSDEYQRPKWSQRATAATIGVAAWTTSAVLLSAERFLPNGLSSGWPVVLACVAFAVSAVVWFAGAFGLEVLVLRRKSKKNTSRNVIRALAGTGAKTT